MVKGGIAALIDRIDPNVEYPIDDISIDDIIPDPDNYRRDPTKKSLEDLISSVSQNGLLQPITVEKINGKYKIISGHRRYFASLAAGKKTILAKVFPRMTKRLRQLIQIAENTNKKKIPQHDIAHNYWDFYRYLLMYESKGEIGEEELKPYESYWSLPEEYQEIYSLSYFAERLGKSRSTVRDAFRFQKLHSLIKRFVQDKQLSYSAAIELARVDNKTQQLSILTNQLRTDKGFAKAQTAKKVVAKYLRSLRGEIPDSDNGVLWGGEEDKPKLSKRSELMKSLNDSIKFMQAFMQIAEIDPEIMNYKHNGDKVYTLIYNENEIIKELNTLLCEKAKFYNQICNKKPRKTTSHLEKILSGELRRNSNGRDFLKGQKVKRIAIKNIRPDPKQLRREMQEFLTLEKLAKIPDIVEMSESLKELGQFTPIILRPVHYESGPDKGEIEYYKIVIGHRRTNGARLARLEYMQAFVLELDDIDAAIIQHEEDIHEQDDLRDRAERIYNQFQLKRDERETAAKKGGDKDYIYTVSEFAREQVGISVGSVRMLLEYHDLDEKTKNLYEAGLIRKDVAMYLGEIPEEQRFFYSLYAILNNCTKNEVVKYHTENTEFAEQNIFNDPKKPEEFAALLQENVDEVTKRSKRKLLSLLSDSVSLPKEIITDLERNGDAKLLYKDEPLLQKIFKFYKTYQDLKGAVRKKRA